MTDNVLDRVSRDLEPSAALVDRLHHEFAAQNAHEKVDAHATGDRFRGNAIAYEGHHERETGLAIAPQAKSLDGFGRCFFALERHRCRPVDIRVAEQSVGQVSLAADRVVAEDRLAHEQEAVVVRAPREADDAVDVARRREHRLAKPPTAKLLARLCAASDIPPKPVEILAAVVTLWRVIDNRRITAKTGCVKVFVDKPPDGAALAIQWPLNRGLQSRQMGLESGEVTKDPSLTNARLMKRERHPNRLGSISRVDRVLN